MVEIKFCVRLSYLKSCTKVFRRFVTETLLTLKVTGREVNRQKRQKRTGLKKGTKENQFAYLW